MAPRRRPTQVVAIPKPHGTPPTIHALTGVRAIAAGWVVANHLGEAVYQLLPAARFLEPLTVSGFLGVDVFFVLSGFIISYNYAERLTALDRRSYRTFILARVARVYPVHLFALVLMAVVIADAARRGSTVNGGQALSLWSFVGNAAMLQAVPGVTPWNWPSWSVSTEFAAYLVFPFVAATVFRLRRRTALALALGVMAAQLTLLTTPMSASSYMVTLMWGRIAGEFAVGCLLWAAWRHGVRRHWWWDLAAVVSLTAALVVAARSPGDPMTWLAVPFLAVFVVSVASSASVVQRFFASRSMQWGGRVSYSVYLVHSPVLAAIWLHHPPALADGEPRSVRLLVVIAWIAAVMAAATVTYYLVEEPARNAIRRRIARSAASSGAGDSAPSIAPVSDSRDAGAVADSRKGT